MNIIKRDGTVHAFYSQKIALSVMKALQSVDDDIHEDNIEMIVAEVMSHIYELSENPVPIERIQDVAETRLMALGYYDAAKSFILYRHERAQRRMVHGYKFDNNTNLSTPWGEMGYVTYRRTYSRIRPDGSGEEFDDTIRRVLEACQTQLHVGFTQDELKTAYKYLYTLKCSVAGRFMWQLGTHTVSKLGLASLQNCAFTAVNHPIRPFVWIFDFLMLGSGCGFSIERKHVDKIPEVLPSLISVKRIDRYDADFIVPDSREGWVSLLERVLEAYFNKGKSFTYSTVLIRSAGKHINGFGGVASGPESLCVGISQICDVLDARRGKKLRSIDCLDIINIIASVVVSGNVRRSALLAIGDPDDVDYLRAKRWDLGNIPNWRAMSNNSVATSDISQLPEEFWEGYNGNGEPYGLINLDLARSIGRLKDGDKYPDPDVIGFNPCAEQGLANFETCCLAEMFLPNLASLEEAKDVAKVLYRICKHSLMMPCHADETADIVHKNMRMGIGVTGYLQATEEQRGWLDSVYTYLRDYDVEYSALLGCPTSIKLTTCKPSGTLSLLAGVTPGVHPAIYQYFIRRMRISTSNPLVEVCRSHGYYAEFQRNFDGTFDQSTTVVEFPCRYPKGVTLAKDTSAIDQLEYVRRLQSDWSDNSVSVTVYYRLEELPAIREWLAANYTNNVKTVSFLLHNEHGFAQAPYEEISEDEYMKRKSRVTAITHMGSGDAIDDLDTSAECVGGVCPIK